MNDSWRGPWWATIRDGFRARLWPLPTTAVVVAVALGVLIPEIESHHRSGTDFSTRSYLFSGGAEAGRAVLETVAGSLITVTSLTFSLTVVTLQLASSQFSPRLLRTFTRDVFVQGTLGVFLGTFAYSLTVLRTVRTSTSGHDEFVPGLSITLAFVFTVASVIALIAFLAHLAQTIRVESMLRSVHKDASATVRRELAMWTESAPPGETCHLPTTPSRHLLAPSSGFLVRVHEADLLEAAASAGAVVALDLPPGGSTVNGSPVGQVWATELSEQEWQELSDRLQRCLVTGFERTAVQDVALGLRQVTDVAVKALSPGINDPTTAVHALGHSSALLGELSRRDLGTRLLRDGEGQVRVFLARPGFADLLHLAVDQPARYGRGEPAVLIRLLELLRELAWSGHGRHVVPVRLQLDQLRRLIDEQDFDLDTRGDLNDAAHRVEEALGGRWPASGARSIAGADGPAAVAVDR